MYTATVPILALSPFQPYTPTGQNMSATFGPPNNTSATPGSTITAPTPNSLLVSVPPDYVGAVQVTFQLPVPGYVLIGISVNPTETPNGKMSVGRQEFFHLAGRARACSGVAADEVHFVPGERPSPRLEQQNAVPDVIRRPSCATQPELLTRRAPREIECRKCAAR